MTFGGFGEEAIEFYDGLLADNSKAYWTDRKAVYEEHVRAPMQALLADLEPEFGRGKIFRPYRDVRFSRDKSPYKTACGATAGPFYVQVSAEGLMAAGGYYQMTSDQVARFRTAVDDERRGAGGGGPDGGGGAAQEPPARGRLRPPPARVAASPVALRLALLAPRRRPARARGA